MSSVSDAVRMGRLVIELTATFDGSIKLSDDPYEEARMWEDLIDWDEIRSQIKEMDRYLSSLVNSHLPSLRGVERRVEFARYFENLKQHVSHLVQVRCAPRITAAYGLGILLVSVVLIGLPEEFGDDFLKRLATDLLMLGVPQESIAHLARPLLSEEFAERAEGATRIEEQVHMLADAHQSMEFRRQSIEMEENR